MSSEKPVSDWATDFDIYDPEYIKDPAPVWKELRGRCPIAHTDRRGGAYMPMRYEDLQAMVKMVPELSSKMPSIAPMKEGMDALDPYNELDAPPISADPPVQIPFRRLILPFFAPKAVAEHRPFTEQLCHELIDKFIAKGTCDAAVQYAQEIPGRVIGKMLGIDPARNDEFVDWVRNNLELGATDIPRRKKYRRLIRDFFAELITERRQNPGGGDIISQLITKEIDDEPVTDRMVIGMCNLLLVAGIDTTWSSIGAGIYHFATHAEDRRRIASEPALLTTAVEELLRYYSPVTMGRVAADEVSVGDVTFKTGDRIMMSFPAANRDPEMFENPDEVVLDREKNRHIAFGIGIHRCAGSNLARLEMEVAIKTWFERIPEFELSDPDGVTWAGGQVRGPRNIPLRF